MSLGEKIADSIPEPVIVYVHEHPRVLTIVTGALVVVTMALAVSAAQLDAQAGAWRKARLGEIQIAASEALGG
jgi:hypothetical protein